MLTVNVFLLISGVLCTFQLKTTFIRKGTSDVLTKWFFRFLVESLFLLVKKTTIIEVLLKLTTTAATENTFLAQS